MICISENLDIHLHAKFTLIEQLSNIHKASKDSLKIR